jgi:hypothetical protein
VGHDLDRRIGVVAAGQHGVFVRARAIAVGFTDDQIRYRIRRGRWVVAEPGLYSVAGAALTWESSVMGELLLAPEARPLPAARLRVFGAPCPITTDRRRLSCRPALTAATAT